MTIDERLEKLAERHESLAQAMELHRLESEDQWRKEAERRQKQDDRWQKQAIQMETVRQTFVSALESIHALERIATAHETRLSHLERES